MNDNQQLENRIEKLEKEVAYLKRVVGERTDTEALKPDSSVLLTKPADSQDTDHTALHKKQRNVSEDPLHTILQAPDKKEKDWEHTIGRVWLPRVFIIVLLFGVLWGFKAAVSYGILSDPFKVIGGYIVAFALLYAGMKQVKKQREVLGQVLLGGAVSVLLLTTIAGHLLYGIIPAWIAFPLNMAWIASGIYISHKFHSEAIAMVAAIGGFLIPFLLENPSGNPWFFVLYVLALYGALLQLALLNRYRIVYGASFVLLPITLLVHYLFVQDTAVIYGVFGKHALLLFAFLRKKASGNAPSITLFSSFVLTVLAANLIVEESSYWSLGFLVVYGLVTCIFHYYPYLGTGKNSKFPVAFSIAAFALAICTYQAIDDVQLAYSLLTVQGIISIYLGLRMSQKASITVSSFIFIFGLLASLSTPIEKTAALNVDLLGDSFLLIYLGLFIALPSLYFRNRIGFIPAFVFIAAGSVNAIAEWAQNIQISGIMAWSIAVVSLFLLYLLLENKKTDTFFLAWLMASLVAAGLWFMTYNANLISEPLSLEFRRLTVSLIWLSSAIAGMVIGVRKDIKGARLIGVLLLFTTLIKIVFFDLFILSIPVRSALFIGLGAVGLLASRFFYKKGETERKTADNDIT